MTKSSWNLPEGRSIKSVLSAEDGLRRVRVVIISNVNVGAISVTNVEVIIQSVIVRRIKQAKGKDKGCGEYCLVITKIIIEFKILTKENI